jgi:hypothetical protein
MKTALDYIEDLNKKKEPCYYKIHCNNEYFYTRTLKLTELVGELTWHGLIEKNYKQ